MKTNHLGMNITNFFHKVKLENLLFALFLIGTSVWYFIGIPSVPFHPDESTYLYSSDDISTLLSEPSQVFWEPGREADRKVALRMLDAPLRRYAMEIGRLLVGKDSLPVDWDWAKTWQENQQAGSLPDTDLLIAGRFSIAIFFPLSLCLVYMIGCKISNPVCGFIAAILFASNALILLHTRRAMAEGILIFTILLAVWVMTLHRKRIVLIALTTALAFCAKQSAGILFFVGALAIIFDKTNRTSASKLISRLLLYSAIFCAVIFILNPFMWKYPVQANLKAVEMRNILLEKQVTSIYEIRPDLRLDTFSKRASALLIQLFFKQPDISDVGNYLEDLKSESEAYSGNILNHLFRDMIGGTILLTLSIYGFLLGIVKITRNRSDPDFCLTLLWISGILFFITFSVVISLPYQRYSLPLAPFTFLFSGYVCGSIYDAMKRKKNLS